MLQNTLQEITRMLKQMLKDDEYLYLDSALVAKRTPHTPAVNIWALCVSPNDTLYAMTYSESKNEEWHKVEATDYSANIVIPTIYQRVKRLYPLYATLPNALTA